MEIHAHVLKVVQHVRVLDRETDSQNRPARVQECKPALHVVWGVLLQKCNAVGTDAPAD